jgi:Apea-like HEPN
VVKFDDKETKALLVTFLNQAFASVARDSAGFEKIRTREAGLRVTSGLTFFIDQAMQSAENDIVSKLVSKMGPQLGHYTEIANAIWNVTAKGFADGQNPVNPQLAIDCFTKIEALASITVQFVHPAYNVELAEGVKEIRVGPITIREGLNVASRLSKQNDKITFGVEQPAGFQSDEKGFLYNVSETMWDIEVSSSSAARFEYAGWLTCIATSVIRLVVEHDQMGPMQPRRSDIENQPFDRHRTSDEHIIVEGKGSFSLGSGKAGRLYELGKKAKQSLSKQRNVSRISLVFNPPNKSLAQRFSQGLGWLAKGRQAKDRSERFLFFFTALEALLSSDDKTSPVVQTIARHAAVLWTNDISGRIKVSQKIRKLYGTRSALIHAGSRCVTYESATEIHEIAECVFYAVWGTTDLKISHSRFCEKLSEASYGLPFFDE